MLDYLLHVWNNILHLPTGMLCFFGVLAGIVYLIGIRGSIKERTVTDYEISTWKPSHIFDSGCSVWYTRRNPRPGDMFYALWWPLRTIWSVFWSFVWMFHEVLPYPLLLVGVSYKDTRLYEKIDRFIDRRYLK